MATHMGVLEHAATVFHWRVGLPSSSVLVYDAPASCLESLSYAGTWTPLVRIGEEGPVPQYRKRVSVCLRGLPG